MNCAHDGFHSIHSAYDHLSGVLVFFWSCEHCGARLDELYREAYRPRFDPLGNERYAAPLR